MAGEVAQAAGQAKSAVTGGLKWAWSKYSWAMTAGGLLLAPFVLSAAGGAAMVSAAAAKGIAVAAPTVASNAGLWASFHSVLWTDPVTGATGIAEGFNRMAQGGMALGKSAMTIASAGLNPGSAGVLESMKTAFMQPLAV